MHPLQEPQHFRIGSSGRAALRLLACCPRVPTDVAALLLGMRHTRSAAQLLLHLRTARLARYTTMRPGPLLGSKAVRLWRLTPAGQAIVSTLGLAPPLETRNRLPYGQPARWRDVARQRGLPMLVAAYRLLARVVGDVDRPVCVAAWEHPWIRTVTQTGTGNARHVRVPAAALVQQDADGGSLRRFLLLPDVGTLPVASYRAALRGLIELAHLSDGDGQDDALLVVGVAAGSVDSGARVAAWHVLLQQVAMRSGAQPLRARVLVWAEMPANARDRRQRSGSHAEQMFALVARHPLLTRRQIAVVLDISNARVGALIVQLTAHGWVRALQSCEAPSEALGCSSGQQRGLALVELTPAGRREAARRLLLPVTAAVRHHGLLGKGVPARQFLRHLAHTLGANAVFVAFVSAARQVSERGGDDALAEWRSAAACARGRFRPDGYGCYRRDGSRFGFFVEFDRGTEKPREYAAKLAAYYRYRDSNEARRHYDGFPTLLVVTTRTAAESRFTYQAYLAQQRHSATPLSILLTTTGRIKAHTDGVLGPIWRSTAAPWAAEPARGSWLPARGAKPA
jgi:hypothetical protein